VTAGSFLQHLRLQRYRSASLDLLTTKNTIKMVHSDSTSGSKMAGMALMLMIGCLVISMAADLDPGPHSAQKPKLGGCHCLRKHMLNWIRIMTELWAVGARKA